MKKLLFLPIISILIGCGGGSSYSYEEDIEPTAKITEDDARFLAPLVYETADRFPRGVLQYSRALSVNQALEQEEEEEVVYLPDEGVDECDEGNITITYLKGSSSDKYNLSGSVEYKEVYNSCNNGYYTQIGTIKNEKEWSKEDNITTIDENYLQEGEFNYIKDSDNSYRRKSFEGVSHEKRNEENSTYSYLTKYEGELKYEGKLYNFKNFKKDESVTYSFAQPGIFLKEVELTGIIDSKEFDGTVDVKTIKKLKFESDCIDGEIEIKASNHTVSIVCSEDGVKYYFDKEELD